ncbi:hypothetical protein [Ostreiculturibacter nitratireducens]|uniref:hypothetical protein n=1 Tax=Ostreiculturibacter nitratireducens TaxID=3075226 RepID=UPI0031B5AA0F
MKLKLFWATVLFALASPAVAETYDAGGTGHGTAMNEAMPVSEDLVVIHAVSQYDRFDTTDPDSPMSSLKGPCFGSLVIKAGQVSGDGNCHYADKDGDMVIMAWTAEGLSDDGRTMGSWSVVGGSGKWAEASGGGGFLAGEDAAGVYTNEITGEVMLP